MTRCGNHDVRVIIRTIRAKALISLELLGVAPLKCWRFAIPLFHHRFSQPTNPTTIHVRLAAYGYVYGYGYGCVYGYGYVMALVYGYLYGYSYSCGCGYALQLRL
jgi:hypothetical protein